MVNQHPFEKVGLGLAPFRVVGFDVRKYQACHGAPVQPGAACDFCGTGIMNVFTIQSADGKRFVVGCDCVAKTGDVKLREEVVALRRTIVRDARHAEARARKAAESAARAERMAAARSEILANNAELADAFTVDHPIIRDISERLTQFGTISDAQKALVIKLAAEARKPPEVLIPAPIGRVEFEGEIVSIKDYEGAFGPVRKMIVKVVTDTGNWLAFGTIPQGCYDAKDYGHGKLVGSVVRCKATLKRGRDAHFALMSRPHGTLTFVAL